jgi:hypothetical protein
LEDRLQALHVTQSWIALFVWLTTNMNDLKLSYSQTRNYCGLTQTRIKFTRNISAFKNEHNWKL